MDSFQSIYNAVRRTTRPLILRKLEMIFYFIFIALCFIAFILPFAGDINKATSYTVGVLSLIYAIGLYFLRLKIKVTFGLVIHTAAFLLFSSFLILDFGLYEIGGVFLVLGLMCIAVIGILRGLGHRVFANGVNEPPVNQAWPEVDNQANVDIQDQIDLNHWHFNNAVNSPEMPNDVNLEMLNVANPEMQGDNNIDSEMLTNEVADPEMQGNDNVNSEMLTKGVADPEMQGNDNVNSEMLTKGVANPEMQKKNNNVNSEMLTEDVANPEMQENSVNSEMLTKDVIDPQTQENDNIYP